MRYSLSHHLRALCNVCSQALACASALDRICRVQPPYLLMAARQTSNITTTTPPAPTLATNVETESAVFTTPVVVFPLVSNSTRPQSLRRSRWSLVPGLQRSHLAKCSQGRLQACSYSSPSPLFAEPSCQDRSDSLSCHSEPRWNCPSRQVTRLQMSHPTTTNSVDHATQGGGERLSLYRLSS